MQAPAVQKAALIVPQLPSLSAPFALAPPATPTCSSALVHPWQLGAWSDTALSPFDDVDLLGKEISDLRWCGLNTVDAAGKPTMAVVECSECPIGYDVALADVGPLMCRDPPSCGRDGACQDCRLSALTPWLVGPCESCISYGCNPDTKMCMCNEF